MPEKRLLILDGYSLLYRAFYGVRFMSTSDGRPTNALYGMLNMLYMFMEKQQPQALLVALDAPGKTFRHAEYQEYKGTRREMPEEMRSQMPIARELLRAMGIPQIELVGYEADDIIGTISLQAEANGYHTFVITGDLDALQLVDECVNVVTPKMGFSETVVYDTKAVIERYGFGPTLIPDYKALVGDTSDNIPGVPGVGDKTASKLIQDWGSVEQIIESLPQIEEKFRKKIIPGLEQIPKSKWLATIDRHVPIEWDFASLTMSRECVATAKAMLESLEMKTHVRRFDQIFGRYIEGMEDAEPIAEVALETLVPKTVDSPRNTDAAKAWIGANPVGLHAAPGAAQTDLFGSAELLWFAGVGDQVASITPEIATDLFREIPSQVVAHDAKKYQQGTILMDTLLAGYVLQSGRANYTLRDLAIAYLDVTPPETPEQQAMALVKLEQVMSAKLTQEHQLNILTQMEQPLAPVLAGMERAGIKVSREYLEDFSRTLAATIETSTATIYELAGQTFLIGSPKQLGEILFEKLGIPGSKKTKTGYATGAEILQLLAAQYPICAEVMTWRELSKLKSTYADSLPKMIAEDGRIHTNYNQTVAATGRLSSESPNLQNIPIRTELGRKIRRAFTAADGFELASFDYSQIELRLLAHMCEDVNLVEAFRTNADVHAATAALTFNVDLTEVTKEQRRYAKVLNFAVLYGVTDFGLAQQLGGEFSISEAKELIRLYNERFPAVKAFTESVVAEARKTGYTTTLLGRRRYFPDIHAANRNERMYAERQAMNAPIQGSAADMIKLAMIDVAKLLVGKQTKMLLQVHDELVFELHPSEKAELLEPIRDAMVHAMPLNVPVGVDAKIGNNWEEMVAI